MIITCSPKWEGVVPLNTAPNVVALFSMVSLTVRDSVTLKYGYHGVRATTLIFELMQKCNVLLHYPFDSRVLLSSFACTICEYPGKETSSVCLALIKYCSKFAACSASWSKSSGLKAWKRNLLSVFPHLGIFLALFSRMWREIGSCHRLAGAQIAVGMACFRMRDVTREDLAMWDEAE